VVETKREKKETKMSKNYCDLDVAKYIAEENTDAKTRYDIAQILKAYRQLGYNSPTLYHASYLMQKQIPVESTIDPDFDSEEIADRLQLEHSWTQSRYDQETRNYAASSLVDALLASCDTQAERIELSVNLLGYDPR